jgi:hypothetical protein
VANVFIWIPAFGRQISTTTFESTHALMSAFYQKGVQASIASFSWPDIDEARNCALSYWYDCCPESSHLLMVDADMGFHPNMVLDMLTFGEPLVGAIYPKKCFPIEWVGSGIDSPEYRSGFIEVEGLGAGCLLIRRDAITAMIEKFPEMIHDYCAVPETRFMGAKRTLAFFDSFRIKNGKVSEDIAFCRRFREAGGKVWGSTAYQIAHVGLYEFSHCFAKEREESGRVKQHQEQLAANMRIADEKFTAYLQRDAISVQEAQELIPILGPAATHNLRNAVAERMGSMKFDNAVHTPESLNGKGAA